MSVYNIERVYNRLETKGYTPVESDQQTQEKRFEINFKGVDLVVFRVNNLDEDTQNEIGSTFTYCIEFKGNVIEDKEKSVPEILKSI